jgi:hypothetical protein
MISLPGRKQVLSFSNGGPGPLLWTSLFDAQRDSDNVLQVGSLQGPDFFV